MRNFDYIDLFCVCVILIGVDSLSLEVLVFFECLYELGEMCKVRC